MIYGVTIFLNDVNFNAKERFQKRLSYQEFFTNLKSAKDFYLDKLRHFDHEKSIVYGKREPRGTAELYKAVVKDGQIMNYGKSILFKTT